MGDAAEPSQRTRGHARIYTAAAPAADYRLSERATGQVATLHDVGSFGPRRTPFHLVEFAPLGNLEEHIRARQDEARRLAAAASEAPPTGEGPDDELRLWVLEPLDWAIQIARGLRFLHGLDRPIIHSDVK